MANIKSIGGNPIVLGLDGLDEDVLAAIAAQPEVTSGTEDEAAWLTRETAAGFPVGGKATIRSIKGKTVKWNQLNNPAASFATSNVDASASSGIITITSTTSSSTAKGVSIVSNSALVVGHKYFACADILLTGNTASAFMSAFNNNGSSVLSDEVRVNAESSSAYARAYTMGTLSSVPSKFFGVRLANGTATGDGCKTKNIQLFDLTLMFGAGNEPSTVAEFERLYPEAYYPYSAPTLQSAHPTGIESEDADGNAIGSISIPIDQLAPNGLRSAGDGSSEVCDELTADALVTRVGSRAYQSGDESDATVTTDGTTTHYPLSTPTTTPIDPPLNMTYRCEAGGTETVTHTEATSAPTLDVVYEIDGAAAAASIAPLEGRIASTNYATGSLIMLGSALVKATTTIVTGEEIIIGTNCSTTTVAAELAALA